MKTADFHPIESVASRSPGQSLSFSVLVDPSQQVVTIHRKTQHNLRRNRHHGWGHKRNNADGLPEWSIFNWVFNVFWPHWFRSLIAATVHNIISGGHPRLPKLQSKVTVAWFQLDVNRLLALAWVTVRRVGGSKARNVEVGVSLFRGLPG